MTYTTTLLSTLALLTASTAAADPRPVHVGLVGEGGEARVRGFDLGLLGSRIAELRGVQLALGLGTVEGDLAGVQLAAGAAASRGDGEGLQLAGGAAMAGGLAGAQLAPVTIARALTGAQVGAVNVAGAVRGVQVGAVNVAARARGLQLGAVNVARRSRGLVVGAVNLLGDHDGEAIGILTFARNGVHDVSAFTSDTMAGNVALRLGGRHLYTSFHFGYHPGDAAMEHGRFARETRRFGTGLGMGWRFRVDAGPLSHVDVEALGMSLRHVAFGSEAARLGALRVQAAIRVAPNLHVIAGAGLNASLADDEMVELDRSGFEAAWTVGGHALRVFPGFVLGLSS